MAAALLDLLRGVWRGNPRATPARFVLAGFAAVIVLGALLLLLPIAREGPGGAGFVTALFTATSAVCVTGLIVVDTPGYWTTFGEVVILGLIQVGGFGIMTSASLLGLLISRRFGLRLQVSAQAETKTMGLGDVRRVVTNVALISIAFEIVTAGLLAGRFFIGYHEPVARAAYLGVFHAVSAFNNAGFALFSDSLMRFTTDAWICLPVLVAVIAGGLGFPVLIELRRELRRPGRWSLHTKITLVMTGILIAAGLLLVLAIGADRGAARRRRRGRGHLGPARDHALPAARGVVRGHLRVRHRRAVHRHHRPAVHRRRSHSYSADVHRTTPILFASALALRERDIRYRLPEERPLVG